MSLSDDVSRVIGYFAVCESQVLLDQDACIVVGSISSMDSFLATQSPKNTLGESLDFRAKKIRFGAIQSGLAGGGAYAFDSDAYARFVPLANENGYSLNPDEFSAADDNAQSEQSSAGGLSLITIRRGSDDSPD